MPSGTETLMPSFCAPLGLEPNAAMTRPRTGQRKVGIADVTSALVACFGGSGSCLAGVTIAALGADEGATEATFGAAAGLACATAAGGLAAACGERTPGMTIRSPTLTIV